MAAALALVLAGCGRPAEQASPKPPKVTVTQPEQRAVLEYDELPGRVAAIDHVVVKARVIGYLNKVHFQRRKSGRVICFTRSIPGNIRRRLLLRRPPYSSRRLNSLRHIPITNVRRN